MKSFVSHDHRGMTLLEVLISCGILVVGLSSIASLLPAAGSRLGQAAVEDRAGSMAAIARTELFARNLIALDMFADRSKAIAFGKGLQLAVPEPLDDQNRNGRQDAPELYVDSNGDAKWSPGIGAGQNAFGAVRRSSLVDRIDLQRGFLLEDELIFSPPSTSDTPGNEFPQGRRAFKEGLCWGATLVPDKIPAEPGGAAVLCVPVFRKEPTPLAIGLRQIPDSGGLYRMETLDRNILKRFLAGCSSVLVPSINPSRGPRWCRITSSWEAGGTGFIVFDDTDFAQFAGDQPNVIAFENMVRIDRYTVALQ